MLLRQFITCQCTRFHETQTREVEVIRLYISQKFVHLYYQSYDGVKIFGQSFSKIWIFLTSITPINESI